MSQLLEKLFKPINLPGWVFLLVWLFIEIPNWAGQIAFWTDIASRRLPTIMPVISILETPLARALLVIVGFIWLIVTAKAEIKDRPKLKKFRLLERKLDGEEYLALLPIRNESIRTSLYKMDAFIIFSQMFGSRAHEVHLPGWLEWSGDAAADRYLGTSETRHLILAIYDKKGRVNTFGWQPATPRQYGHDAWMGSPPTHERIYNNIPYGTWKVKIRITGIGFSKTFTLKVVASADGIKQPL